MKVQEACLLHSGGMSNFILEQTVWRITSILCLFDLLFEKWIRCQYCYLSIKDDNVQANMKAVVSVIAF